MSNSLNRKLNPNNPVSLLIHGSNDLSLSVAKSLVQQGGNVILVDEFNSKSKKYITELKAIGNADFIEFKGLSELLEKLPRVDYVYYFLNDYLVQTENFSSKEFLDETTYLNTVIKAAKKFDSKIGLITSIKLNQDLSAHILNKKLSAPAPYSNIELQKYCETLMAENRDKLKVNTRIIRVGSILGGENQTIEDSTVERLINESINKPDLTIYGEGLDVHYLINISDATYGILKLTFTDKTEGEVISLCNNHDYTTLSLAYKLLELNPDIVQIRFQPASDGGSVIFDQYVPATNATQYGWVQKTSIEQSLGQAIQVFNPEKGKRILESPKERTEQESIDEKLKAAQVQKTPIGNVVHIFGNPFKRIINSIKDGIKNERESFTFQRGLTLTLLAIISVALLYFIFIPLTGIVLSSYLIYSNTKSAVASVTSFDFSSASKSLEKAQTHISKDEVYLNRIKWMFDVAKKESMFENTSQLLSASDYALSGAITLTNSLEPLAQYAKEFTPSLDIGSSTPSSTREYRIYLKELETNLKGIDKAGYSISIASELLDKVDVTVFPTFTHKYLTEIKLANQSIINNLIPANDILPFIPDMLGVDKRQRYLILLQNPGELRATGGWLSSYAIVSIEGGQLRELKVDDVYNAEGQLRIAGKTFEAPKDMQKALNLSKWSLSLSNWNPDFKDTAASSTYFLSQLDPGAEFDGVISIDTNAVKKLLDKWGGVAVPGESTPITSANLDERIFQLHKDFQPGESIKSTFLANLANETLKKIFTLNFDGLKDISEVLTSSLNEKNILVYFADKEINDFFVKSNWSGSISSNNQWTPIPVEWNWGANKANLYLEKNYNTSITIVDESKVDYEYTVFMKNKSISNIYPQGDYKNYYRIFLPRNAEIKSVRGFDNEKYTTYIQSGYMVVGGWYTTPIKSTKSLQIKYSIHRTAQTTNFAIERNESEKSMNLDIFKQPGTISDVYDISITYPESWATVKHDGLNRAINTLTARFNTQTDKKYTIIWEEKN